MHVRRPDASTDKELLFKSEELAQRMLNKWILRFVLCHQFRSYSARHFGLICATFRLRRDPFRFDPCHLCRERD
ncbi:MAG: hypothetical protein R3250_04510, partial [Melioribacteraceae bacterium]|nr:hypothetical protein [Melioribacteraceae bacterium]